MNNARLKTYLLLHVLLLVYSATAIVSKYAARFEFMSFPFIVSYVVVVAILGVYALGWQQVLKRLPLTTAYSSKAVVVIWGIIWGCLFFSEPLTLPKVAGAVLIVAGVILFGRADADDAADAPGVADARGADGTEDAGDSR